MHRAGFNEQYLRACRRRIAGYVDTRDPGQVQAARCGFEHGADLLVSSEFPAEHYELAVVGEKLEASVDVVGVEGQRIAGQQVADRAVIGHWALASCRPAAAPRRNA